MKDNAKNTGLLVVITGASGAGKDAVMDGVFKDPQVAELNLQRVVTCADRSPRPGEIDGVQYHFVDCNKLKEMAANGELVEPITPFGTSNKATPSFEIKRMLDGENLVWRIDPSRAAEVASHKFFQKSFPENSEIMDSHTIVLNVIAPREEIVQRRMKRDGQNYDPNEYIARDNCEAPYLKILREYAVNIENLDGQLDKAIESASGAILRFYGKTKNG